MSWAQAVLWAQACFMKLNKQKRLNSAEGKVEFDIQLAPVKLRYYGYYKSWSVYLFNMREIIISLFTPNLITD
jgi:hypothetical protein